MRHPYQIISLLLLVPLLASTGGHAYLPTYHSSGEALSATASSDPTVTVTMTNTMKFEADTVRISTGETVRWENTSLLAHSVTADPSEATLEKSARLPDGAEAFDSGMLDPGESYEHTFREPGTYRYFCIPHEAVKMYGWVIVNS
ncbi:MAG: plastocyanin/azurin family copper-binding protein [Balneolaceae bacterium]|nr:plastocyanin/azurin family copper-binding protein [Balneolaceae bacterium]